MTTGSLRIPLRAAYTGLAVLPWLALAHSDIVPLLVLHDDAIETRVIWRRRRRPYGSVARVDILSRMRRTTLVLTFAGTPFTFGAVLAEPAPVADVVRRLSERGCPLGPEARARLVR